MRDTVVFSIIDSEWPAVKRHLQSKLERRRACAMSQSTIGLVGARGYVGAELIALIAAHPRFELAFVSSREREGQRARAITRPATRGDAALRRLRSRGTRPRRASTRVVLALPNGKAAPFVAAIDALRAGHA